MENLTLLEKFANPDLMHSLTMGEKLLASFYVMILGMGVTFVVLMLLWFLISVMSSIVGKKKQETVKPVVVETPRNETASDQGELIAVIAAAVAASLGTSTNNIVVRNIVRVGDATPSWGRIGRIEQMNSRF
jgi:sodium pump decarboxylase gamma subunit